MKKIFFFILYRLLLRPFLKIFVGVNFEINDAFSKQGQYIIVANHNSHIDAVAILACLPFSMLDKVHPVAAIDYFGKNKISSFLSEFFVNALLVERKCKDEVEEKNSKAIDKMIAYLDRGESLLIFPEGTRGEAGRHAKFKKGIAVLLKSRPQIPFVPIYLKDTGNALPKGDGMLVPYDSYVFVGSPIWINPQSSIEEILTFVETSIFCLQSGSRQI
ncbi:MAG: hypothetical protein A2381_05420 [Bdellovibrionales bacterium RIFOXYB1_FULL_37_110]|nr:MAG: hypothetical protein A2417_16900 [Bdellovibrionales bacterium RIFOXYC1_FULL_37_79]OFZ58186.1 MAG: hypothetical protein A2381_05420 [Bdellovibrionales bacterium RIFOXYB1_FULL_37_110]OFZ61875.1 MAG: hypothetical protein A2577_19005 [Bdellovibrionales bacterium RIFOXYD1_FULL_36_51]